MTKEKTSIVIGLILIGVILTQSIPITKKLFTLEVIGHLTNVNKVASSADLTPPTIGSVNFFPPSPTALDEVLVNTTISDDQSGVNSSRVSLYYRCDGSTWNQIMMLHLIGGSPSEVYLAHIPTQTSGTKVEFYIEAYDNAGNKTIDDNGGRYYSYVVQVAADKTLPVIEAVTINPSSPTSDDNVTLTCSVSDDKSGVKEVNLFYRTDDGTWNKISMSHLADSCYIATIPKQKGGTTVQYYIEASDNALNRADSDISSYTTKTSGGPLVSIIIAGAFILLAATGIIWFSLKRRKPTR